MRVASFAAMVECWKNGEVDSIGVSNFSIKQILELERGKRSLGVILDPMSRFVRFAFLFVCLVFDTDRNFSSNIANRVSLKRQGYFLVSMRLKCILFVREEN